MPLATLEGTVRLNADNFTFAGFSWNPFQATASLSPNGIKAEIERGDVCGIATAGTVDFTNGEIGLDLVAFRNRRSTGAYQPLSDGKQIRCKRPLFFKAQVTGQGNAGERIHGRSQANSNSAPETASFYRADRGYPLGGHLRLLESHRCTSTCLSRSGQGIIFVPVDQNSGTGGRYDAINDELIISIFALRHHWRQW